MLIAHFPAVTVPIGGPKVRFRTSIRRIFLSSFLRSVALLASATAIGQFILLIFTPLLTRLYDPKEFGLLAVFNAIFAIIVVASSFRYELAIPLPKDDTDGRVLVAVSLSINAAIALIALVIFVAYGPIISTWLSTPEIGPYLPLVALVLLGGGSFKVLTYWSVRKANFRSFARAKLTQAIANVIIQVAAGFAGLGALGLIFGQFVGYSAGTTGLFRTVGFAKNKMSLGDLRLRATTLLREHIRFAIYDAPGALINVFSTQLPNILLAVFFGPSVAGLYMLADRVLSTPASLLSQAIGQVLFSRSTGDKPDSGLRTTTVQIVFRLALLTIPAVVVMFFSGQYLFALIFGRNWLGAGTFACWLAIGIAPLFIYGSISLVLSPTGGQALALYIHSSLLAFRVGAMGVGIYLQSPLALVIGFSLVNAVGYSFAIFMVLRHLRIHNSLQRLPPDAETSG